MRIGLIVQTVGIKMIDIKFTEELLGVKLYWYQKLYLILFGIFSKKSKHNITNKDFFIVYKENYKKGKQNHDSFINKN